MTTDPLWMLAWRKLKHLHVRKSASYGIDSDRLANFTAVASVTGQSPERYAYERIIEKATRAIHMIDAGSADDVVEAPDIAGLALCAEALRMRRQVIDPPCCR